MKFSVNKKKKSNVYARNYGMVLCVIISNGQCLTKETV